MNRGRWQRTWFWCQRELGARWIELLLGSLLQVRGLEHVAATSRERPLLLVANHRSFFDLYVVMSTLFRRSSGWRATCFPVRGRYYYQSIGGLALNALVAWWSMYPPFFHTLRQRRFDQWSLDQLTALCREGPGRLIGFHPEGTRNQGSDPYAFLPAQPGVGRLIYHARPEVVPAFVGGLGNSIGDILARRRNGGEPVRLWFGPALAYQDFLTMPSSGATYRRLAERVMARIAALGEEDRRVYASGSS
jgi:1-acyl-sn-glycerol-3-phosphate acyltransferase